MSGFSFQKPFPPSFFLCGGGSLLPNIRNILKREETQKRWQDKFSLDQPYEVKFIDPSQICNIKDKTGNIKDASIVTSYALASLGMEIAMDQEQAMPPILRRAVRMMR